MSGSWLHGRTRDQVVAFDVFKAITAVTLGILLVLLALPAPKKEAHGHGDEGHKAKAKAEEKPLVPQKIPLRMTFPTAGLTVPRGWWLRIQGMAEPKTEVEVMVQGRLVGRSVANSEGMWSVFTRAESPGPVEARDATGAVTPAIGWDLIEGPPEPGLTLSSVESGARLPVGRNLISGRAAPGSVVLVLFGGLLVAEGRAKDDATWQIEATLPEGEGELIVLDGELSSGSAPVSVVVSREVAQGSLFAWTNPLDGALLVDGTLTLRGLGEAGDTVALARGGTPVGEAKLNSEGRWELQVDHRRVPTDYTATSAKTGQTVRVQVGVR